MENAFFFFFWHILATIRYGGKEGKSLGWERNQECRSGTCSTDAWVCPMIGHGAPCCLETMSRQMPRQVLSLSHMMGTVIQQSRGWIRKRPNKGQSCCHSWWSQNLLSTECSVFLIEFENTINACYVYSKNFVSNSNDNVPVLTVHLNPNFSVIITNLLFQVYY